MPSATECLLCLGPDLHGVRHPLAPISVRRRLDATMLNLVATLHGGPAPLPTCSRPQGVRLNGSGECSRSADVQRYSPVPSGTTPEAASRASRAPVWQSLRSGASLFVATCVKRQPELARGTRELRMTRYLISFGANAMDHIPEADMPTVAKAAHAVVQEALNVGVYVLGHRRTHGRRGALTRGCAAMGCQDRCGLPLCP